MIKTCIEIKKAIKYDMINVVHGFYIVGFLKVKAVSTFHLDPPTLCKIVKLMEYTKYPLTDGTYT